jgi:queuine/archaeosine tRNA-ribosyltransferase
MASNSTTINMPVMFAISIGATVSLLATTMFGLAWYEYEAKKTLNQQVLVGPTHTDSYDRAKAEQMENLGDIDAAILSVAAEHVKDKPAGHEGHGEAE